MISTSLLDHYKHSYWQAYIDVPRDANLCIGTQDIDAKDVDAPKHGIDGQGSSSKDIDAHTNAALSLPSRPGGRAVGRLGRDRFLAVKYFSLKHDMCTHNTKQAAFRCTRVRHPK